MYHKRNFGINYSHLKKLLYNSILIKIYNIINYIIQEN